MNSRHSLETADKYIFRGYELIIVMVITRAVLWVGAWNARKISLNSEITASVEFERPSSTIL